MDLRDPYDLDRFVDAQARVYDGVLAELKSGRKQSHWMWFIFPQIQGLGRSRIAHVFSISSKKEAQAYLAHSVLGPRLLECTRLVNAHAGRSAYDIFGSPDDMKFRSCMTLFAEVGQENDEFATALQTFFRGKPDDQTLAILKAQATGRPEPLSPEDPERR